jgi:small subunit ribosomal protein S3Ae
MPKRQAGKIKDKWKSKTWLIVEAPPSFGNTQIAYIPVTDVSKAAGRVVETTLYDIVKQDPQQYVYKLYFQITEVQDSVAKSILKAYEYSREYLKSLIRRGSSMVTYIKDYTTKDGITVRVYVVAFTQKRINSSRKHAIRMAADKVLREKTASLTYDQFAQEVVLGKIGSDIYNEAKKIAALRHVGIFKFKIVKGVPVMASAANILETTSKEQEAVEEAEEEVEEEEESPTD